MMSSVIRLILVCMVTLCITVSATFAFSPDNRLLNSLYEKIDAVYATSPQRVLHAYNNLTYAKIIATNKPELLYYLEKIETYLHGKLFTFTEQPNFVCLDTYVQKNDTVEIDYTIKQVDGALITTTLEDVAREMGVPLTEVEHRLAFNAGKQQVMPGMDQLVLWAELNEPTTDLIEPKYAYGTYSESKRITFTGKLAPELQVSKLNERVMMQVTIDQETYLLLGTVIEKTTDGAIVDFNHPRAGETIILSLEVMRLFKACNK